VFEVLLVFWWSQWGTTPELATYIYPVYKAIIQIILNTVFIILRCIKTTDCNPMQQLCNTFCIWECFVKIKWKLPTRFIEEIKKIAKSNAFWLIYRYKACQEKNTQYCSYSHENLGVSTAQLKLFCSSQIHIHREKRKLIVGLIMPKKIPQSITWGNKVRQSGIYLSPKSYDAGTQESKIHKKAFSGR